ncbi:heme exporter protein CcmD [Rhodobacterales bacterium HKCCE4037]|nr:heme exporter protein CcmD [Rhodobacterales bacterium HKCCE4037]
MSLDLGQYAVPVLSAYAGALGLLLVLIVASVLRARSVARRLAETEQRRGVRAK